MVWECDELPMFNQLPPADQVWLIALAVEENGGPAQYVRALRSLADQLEEFGWWASGERSWPGCHWSLNHNSDRRA
jgi:hypothetical protein